MPKVQPPELKGFMDKKLSSERLSRPPPSSPSPRGVTSNHPAFVPLDAAEIMLCPAVHTYPALRVARALGGTAGLTSCRMLCTQLR